MARHAASDPDHPETDAQRAARAGREAEARAVFGPPPADADATDETDSTGVATDGSTAPTVGASAPPHPVGAPPTPAPTAGGTADVTRPLEEAPSSEPPHGDAPFAPSPDPFAAPTAVSSPEPAPTPVVAPTQTVAGATVFTRPREGAPTPESPRVDGPPAVEPDPAAAPAVVPPATPALAPMAAPAIVPSPPALSARAPSGSAGTTLVDVRGVSRTYGSGSSAVHALRDVSFTVAAGELLAIKGRSGSGKTTLLNCVGGLDTPDGGVVIVDGTNVTDLDEEGLLQLRRSTIGFVFQSFGLVPILSASENVGLPMRLLRVNSHEREEHVRGLLELVGLGDHAAQRPYELSGGQQQRVAIARALANSPQLLIADEPTGQLDSSTAMDVMELIRSIVRRQGVTAIVATHDPVLLDFADHVLELHDGEIVT